MKSKLLVIVLLLGLCLNCNSQDAIQLFDGKTLNGWKQPCGDAVFSVIDGTIYATPSDDNVNSFLVTEKEYKNFILEFDFRTNNLNSGVQVRSHKEKWYHGGRVYGYQFEIDPSEKKQTGGIYYELGGMWLYDLNDNPQAKEAYHDGWNHGMVMALNDTIRTWVNGIECSHIIDGTNKSGFIGLQAHMTKDPNMKFVQWKNIFIREISVDSLLHKSNINPEYTSVHMSFSIMNYLKLHNAFIKHVLLFIFGIAGLIVLIWLSRLLLSYRA